MSRRKVNIHRDFDAALDFLNKHRMACNIQLAMLNKKGTKKVIVYVAEIIGFLINVQVLVYKFGTVRRESRNLQRVFENEYIIRCLVSCNGAICQNKGKYIYNNRLYIYIEDYKILINGQDHKIKYTI